MVFPENNCPQTVEEALLIRFLNISYSLVCSKIPEDYGTYVLIGNMLIMSKGKIKIITVLIITIVLTIIIAVI